MITYKKVRFIDDQKTAIHIHLLTDNVYNFVYICDYY